MSAGAAETAGIAALLSPSLPAFAVPEERRGLPVPGLRRLLEPGANLGRVLWMLAVERALLEDALDGLGHVQPTAAYSTHRGQPFHAIVGASSTPSRAADLPTR